ncbi:MAG: hypothetical protein ABH885_04940, partial [Candidatus Omnitrophota bacterium]
RSQAQAKTAGGPGYEGYEVWFTFKPYGEIKEEWAKGVVTKEHLFQLYNSWYPGPRYIKRYNIKPGAQYKAVLQVITKGTSTPILFDFKDLKKDDYFETVKPGE